MEHQRTYSNRVKAKRQELYVAVCQNCERNYTLGITGTVEGCDTCLGIERNPRDHSIINPGRSLAFAAEEE
jgi:hypothetical protein